MKRFRTVLAMMMALLTAGLVPAGTPVCACVPETCSGCCVPAGHAAFHQASCCDAGEKAKGACSCGCEMRSASDEQPAARIAVPQSPALAPSESRTGETLRPAGRIAVVCEVPEPAAGRSPPSLRGPPLES